MDLLQTEGRRSATPVSHRALLPFVVAALGLLLSLMVYLFNSHQEAQRYQQRLHQIAQTEAARMQSAVGRSIEVLVAFGGLFSADTQVTRQAYRRFASMVLRDRPGIRAVHWTPRISHAQRPAIEAELATVQPQPLGIFDVTPGADERRPAPVRGEYFPIVYAEPLNGNAAAVGLDPLARPYNTRTIRAAARKQLMDTTPAFPIIQDPAGPLAVAIYNPVYHQRMPMKTEQQRWEALRGYIIMMLRPEVLSQQLWPEGLAGGMSVTLLDQVNGAWLQVFPRRIEGPGTAVSVTPKPFDVQVPLDVPGRHWVLLFSPSEQQGAVQRSFLPQMLLLAMLTLTALAYWLTGRSIQRTSELSDANGRLLERQKILDELAHSDTLTGLLNRRGFDDASARYQQQARQIAVCVVDLDGFKPVNDQYGHAAGDQVLIEVANRLRRCLGDGAVLARTGGDEFVILIAADQAVRNLASCMATLVTQLARPMTLADFDPIKVTASIGVARVDTAHESIVEGVRQADDAMYRAKREGKARFCIADEAGASIAPASVG